MNIEDALNDFKEKSDEMKQQLDEASRIIRMVEAMLKYSIFRDVFRWQIPGTDDFISWEKYHKSSEFRLFVIYVDEENSGISHLRPFIEAPAKIRLKYFTSLASFITTLKDFASSDNKS